MDIELPQFRYLPHNEKVRWALDLKRIPYRRTDLMPGPHMARVRKLSGQTATPVLLIDSRVVCGSAAILRELDRLQPEPPLHTGREDVGAVEDKIGAVPGPRIRRKVLALPLEDHGYFCRVFAEDQGAANAARFKQLDGHNPVASRRGLGTGDLRPLPCGLYTVDWAALVAASRSARLNTSTKADGGWAPETAYFRFTMKQGTPLMPSRRA